MTGKLRGALSRRDVLRASAATIGVATVGSAVPLRYARGSTPLKIGIVLPYSGVYAKFGEGITAGFEYALKKRGGQLGGRPVTILKGDDQLDAKIGGEVTTKLVDKDKVDIVVGPVGSNVAPVMQKICIEAGRFLIIPTAAANALTRDRCHPTTFRISHSNWQMTHPMGAWLFNQGKRRVITMGMDYAAGREMVGGFVDGFKAAGGEIIDQKWPGLKELDYQAYFADVAAKKPDAVFTFFAGANAVEFVKQYAQAGLKERVPLYGAAYLTDSTLIPAQGAAANSVITSAHWAPSLDNAANKTFMEDFKKETGQDADLNSMHGHDTAVVLALALEKTKGDIANQPALTQAIRGVEFASPRGPFRFSCAHNPIQNMYAVEVKEQRLVTLGVCGADVTDPVAGCRSCA